MEHLQVLRMELSTQCVGENLMQTPPGGLQDPKGCFGVCSCLECPKDAGKAGSKAVARMMPLMPGGAGK